MRGHSGKALFAHQGERLPGTSPASTWTSESQPQMVRNKCLWFRLRHAGWQLGLAEAPVVPTQLQGRVPFHPPG